MKRGGNGRAAGEALPDFGMAKTAEVAVPWIAHQMNRLRQMLPLEKVKPFAG